MWVIELSGYILVSVVAISSAATATDTLGIIDTFKERERKKKLIEKNVPTA